MQLQHMTIHEFKSKYFLAGMRIMCLSDCDSDVKKRDRSCSLLLLAQLRQASKKGPVANEPTSRRTSQRTAGVTGSRCVPSSEGEGVEMCWVYCLNQPSSYFLVGPLCPGKGFFSVLSLKKDLYETIQACELSTHWDQIDPSPKHSLWLVLETLLRRFSCA